MPQEPKTLPLPSDLYAASGVRIKLSPKTLLMSEEMINNFSGMPEPKTMECPACGLEKYLEEAVHPQNDCHACHNPYIMSPLLRQLHADMTEPEVDAFFDGCPCDFHSKKLKCDEARIALLKPISTGEEAPSSVLVERFWHLWDASHRALALAERRGMERALGVVPEQIVEQGLNIMDEPTRALKAVENQGWNQARAAIASLIEGTK